ncbi:MAG: hypothetical protein V1894_02180 [Chloroflexota bacterium]
MRKKLALAMVFIWLVLSLPSCRPTVSKAEYDKLNSELSVARLELMTLQQKLDLADLNTSEVAAYTAFVDLSLYPFYEAYGVKSRFNFENEGAWLQKLKEGTQLINDSQLTEYIDKFSNGETATLFSGIDYAIGCVKERVVN